MRAAPSELRRVRETATEASPDDASRADDADVYDVVLFYAYTSIENPEAVVATLKEFFLHDQASIHISFTTIFIILK